MPTATELLPHREAALFEIESEDRGPSIAKDIMQALAVDKRHSVTILMAEDDFDDCILAQEAWEELETGHLLRFVHNGQEVLDYVYHQGQHQDHHASPSPALILLDLNMPKKNGIEVLSVLKADPQLQTIPIIVFTTTKNINHIIQTYKDGANAFMSKPTSYEGYVNALKAIECFWLTLAKLPMI